jgi:exodeoxyribonuclease VII small subunit
MAKKKTNYKESLEELEQIIEEIENNEISVDILSEKVKRASELLKICNTILLKTEKEVESILEDNKDE